MRAKDANLLTLKLKQIKKLIASITPKEGDTATNLLRNNSIMMLTGIIKDVEIIFENDKKFFATKKTNKGIHKTGYPCDPIKPRKKQRD